MASWKKLLTSGTVTASDVVSGTLATARIPSLDASKITSGTIADARLPGDCGARATYDNYSSFKAASSAFDSGVQITSGTKLTIQGGSNVTTSRSGSAITINGTADTNTTYTAGNALTLSGTTFSIADEAITGTEIEANTIESGHLGQECINHGSLISSDVIDSQHYRAGSIDNEHLANGSVDSDILSNNLLYTMQWSTQVPVVNGRYYMPSGTYGPNYYSWNKYSTSMPTVVSWASAFYGLPIVVPKAGKIIKWGFTGAANSSSAFPLNWCLKHATVGDGDSTSATLATVGNIKNVTGGGSGRYYRWRDAGLSHSVAENDTLLPVCYGTNSSSTRYVRGVFYIVFSYEI